MLGVNDIVGGGALRGQRAMQPGQRRRRFRIMVAQPLKQLCRKCVGQPVRLDRTPCRSVRRRLIRFVRQQPVGQGVRLLAQRQAVHDSGCQTGEVLDEHHPQCDADGPQLADGQRLNPLICAAEARQRVEFEAIVGVSDNGPGKAVDPRVSAQVAVGELRQLLVETERQVATHRMNVFVDDVVIVDQPFGRGRHGTPLANAFHQRVKSGIQGGGVGAQSAVQ
jgi:hypothetical protein